MNTDTRPLVITSGACEPFHYGHFLYLRAACEIGDVVHVLNSDSWLEREKHRKPIIMREDERAAMISGFVGVENVIVWDGGCPDIGGAIRWIRSQWSRQRIVFAKGGDRHVGNLPGPECAACAELNIEIISGVGGTHKENNSSTLYEEVTRDRHRQVKIIDEARRITAALAAVLR